MFSLISILICLAQPAHVTDLTVGAGYQSSVAAQGQGYFPVIAKHPDGRVVVVMRGGAGHMGVGGRLDLVFSADGLTWNGKLTAIDTATDDRNPAFGITPKGRLLLGFYNLANYTGEGVWKSSMGLDRDLQTYSDDGGVTWSKFTRLKLGEMEETSPYGRISCLDDGTYIQCVYGGYSSAVPNMPKQDKAVTEFAYLIRSKDEGATWGDPSLIASNANETALLDLKGGNLLAACRNAENSKQHLDLYKSEDNGRTWAHVIKATENSQHPGDLIHLGGNNILLIYGNRQGPFEIRGILSRDGGKTWDLQNQFKLSKPVSKGDFGYPSAAVLGDKLLTVYYWCGSAAEYAYDGTNAQCLASLIPIKDILADHQ